MVIAAPERLGTPLDMPGRPNHTILGNRIVIRAVEKVGPVVDIGRHRFCKFHTVSSNVECRVSETGYKFFVSVLPDHSNAPWSKDPIYFFASDQASRFQDHQQVDQIVHIRKILTVEDIGNDFPINTVQLQELPCRFDFSRICVQALDQCRSSLAKVQKQLWIITANADDKPAFSTEGEEVTVRDFRLH